MKKKLRIKVAELHRFTGLYRVSCGDICEEIGNCEDEYEALVAVVRMITFARYHYRMRYRYYNGGRPVWLFDVTFVD